MSEGNMLDDSFVCPVCIQDSLMCSACGEWINGCECKDMDYIECGSCTFDCTVDELFNCSYDLSKYEQEESDWKLRDDWQEWENSISKKWDYLDGGFGELLPAADDPDKVYECKCDPPKVWSCKKCGCERTKSKGPWGPYREWNVVSKKCRHYGQAVTFPDGVTVYASSIHSHSEVDKENLPDFGLYLESSWRPYVRNEFIHFPDYSMPKVMDMAAEQIRDAYNKARAGLKVETSCHGGHGRTGTVLAAMAIIGGVPRENAVQWVRDNYCHEAIESADQIWWISWFAAYYNGEELPDLPPPPPPKKKSYIWSDDPLGWTKPKAKGPAKQHKKRCKCNECKTLKAIKAKMSDSDKIHEAEILSVYNEALTSTKNVDVAEKITLQRASGHFPTYDDNYGATFCDQCNHLWPCANASDEAVHSGTISDGYVYVPLRGWAWLNAGDYMDNIT